MVIIYKISHYFNIQSNLYNIQHNQLFITLLHIDTLINNQPIPFYIQKTNQKFKPSIKQEINKEFNYMKRNLNSIYTCIQIFTTNKQKTFKQFFLTTLREKDRQIDSKRAKKLSKINIMYMYIDISYQINQQIVYLFFTIILKLCIHSFVILLYLFYCIQVTQSSFRLYYSPIQLLTFKINKSLFVFTIQRTKISLLFSIPPILKKKSLI
ncbi:hypothetical protein ABPG74_011097 [Tetrahymena malaccensis]